MGVFTLLTTSMLAAVLSAESRPDSAALQAVRTIIDASL